MHPNRRKKKKRSRNVRSILISAENGKYGFTLSGHHKDCIISAIVKNSPADMAGLKNGDFLVSVNGESVWQKDHDEIVALIGADSNHQIRISIADNCYTSSDEEANTHQHRHRPKYPHFKTRFNRMQLQQRNSIRSENYLESPPIPEQHPRFAHHFSDIQPPPLPLFESPNVLHSSKARESSDVFNVSAMASASSLMNSPERISAIVGYIGTIEMPKQIASSSKLQTVRSCIRKLRQEKRNPALVLMNILPNCLNLLNSAGAVLATYPSQRINYVSSSSDSNSKFFGLVTSGVYQGDEDLFENLAINQIAISNSCHVFVIDTKLIDHNSHLSRAEKFHIVCTKDPISNSCLEFPTNSEYICNLIRSMYNIKTPVKTENVSAAPRPSAVRNLNFDGRQNENHRFDPHEMANSPHPSNHSEITTTSSNSDSGIGFHNDCANISDRILVVDFPGLNQSRRIGQNNLPYHQRHYQRPPRPFGIVNDVSLQEINPIGNRRSVNFLYPQPSTSNDLPISHSKSKSADYSPHVECPRLAIRAMPDPVIKKCVRNILESKESHVTPHTVNDVWYNGKMLDEAGNVVQERAIDVPDMFNSFDGEQNANLMVRSFDDIIMVIQDEARYKRNENHSEGKDKKKDHVFLEPATKPPRRNFCKKSSTISGKMKTSFDDSKMKAESNLMHYKLSPKVYGVPRPFSMSFENLSSTKCGSLFGSRKKNKEREDESFSIWGSLKELRQSDVLKQSHHGAFLEGTYSEPSLNNNNLDEAKQIPNDVSPFKRWGQSSFSRSRADPRTPLQRRPSSCSENDVYTKSVDQNDDEDLSEKNEQIVQTGPIAWGQSFERLLNDPAGLNAFSEFLKKEFSAENIYFWTACERFRQIDDIAERKNEAYSIFEKHLANGSLEPVNVDSQARLRAQERLLAAEKDLFIQAQKQIFNLMKFDSYQRFIRSDLYKTCLDAENRNLPMPYPGDQLDPTLKITFQKTQTNTMTKLKKSLSNAEDRRRKSLLPWHRKGKTKEREELKDAMKTSSSSNTLKHNTHNSAGDIHSSRSSLSSFDATISKIGSFDDDARSSLCRVILSNGATTIVQIKANETIRELIERLLDKRGICYQAYEAVLSGTQKPLDLDGLSTQLSGNEVMIEQRVIFKLDLPNKKVISVKSKTCKVLSEVLRPILHKYSYRLELVQVFGRDNTDPLEMSLPVAAVDGQRLQIICKDEAPTMYGEVTPITTSQKLSQQNFKFGNAPVTFVKASKSASNPQINTLDEITNKVFTELLSKKANETDDFNNEVINANSEDWRSETSSGIFNRIRRNPKKHQKMISKSSAGSEDGEATMKKPIIAKWKSGAPLIQVTSRNQNDESLLEGLKRAQRSRLEDQRGTEINFELPEFLKDKEKYANVCNKLRKTKFDESPSNSASLYNNIDTCNNNIESVSLKPSPPRSTQNRIPTNRAPQPAPRLSLAGKSPKSSPEVSSPVQSKISSLENAILKGCTSKMYTTNSRSNTPIDLNLSTQCLPSNTPARRSSDSPIYYSSEGSRNSGIYADTTLVFNHHPSSNYENQSELYKQEIEDVNHNRLLQNEEHQNVPPRLPPKPTKIPAKPSNWQTSNNKENFFKVSQESSPRRAPLASVESSSTKSDIYLDQPSSSFV